MKKHTRIHYDTINTCLAVALIALLVVNMWLIGNIARQLVTPPETEKAPVEISEFTVIHLMPVGCNECFNATPIATALRTMQNAHITNETYYADKPEAKALIAQYNISKLPAVILKGDIGKTEMQGMRSQGDALVYDSPSPPFYDVASKKTKGLVIATALLSPGCDKCTDVLDIVDQLKARGVAITTITTMNYTTIEGKRFVEKYNITAVPTLVFSSDAMLYDVFSEVWAEVGTVEKDGMLVLRKALPPYRDLPSNKIRGIVDLTFLVDKSCTACYNATLHKQILAGNFRVSFGKETTLDVSSAEGKALVDKYGITLVPTVLLNAEAKAYAGLDAAWPQVGTEEKDGTFVFRSINLLEGVVYKNLTSGTEQNATAG